MRTKGISPDLLKPVATALAAALTTWIVSHVWGVDQTVLVVTAVLTFVSGYLVAPDANLGPLGPVFDALNLSRKAVAAVVVSLGAVFVTWATTGAFDATQVNVLVAGALGLLLAGLQQPDTTTAESPHF